MRMSKYINVDDQLVRLRALELNCEDVVKQFLLTARAADVQEVRHGRWLEHQEGKWIYAKCSVCNTVRNTPTNYCPNCGAKMEREQNG